MTKNERAAAMRQTWLGDAAGEAVAWDELKQCVRDRWLAVLDAAQPENTPVRVRFDVTAEEFAEKMSPIVGANVDIEIAANVLDLAAVHAVIDAPPGVPSVDDLTIIAWNEMRGLYPRMGLYDQANPLEQGTAKAVAAAIRDAVIASYAAAHGASVVAPRASGEVIERMAKAARESLLPGVPEDDAYWPQWYDAIRAALAAVGPQYRPADVAFSSRVPELERQIADLHRQLSDARREVDEVRRHISVTMSREHQARKEAQEAKCELSHLHPGETVEGVIVERDHYRIRLERAEQDAATFRAELARESEWVRQYKQDRDDALAELEVVKAERDEYLRMYENEQKNADHWKAKAALADAAVSELRDQLDDDNTNAAAVNDLLIQLQNVTAERDAARAELAAAEIELAALKSQPDWELDVSPIAMLKAFRSAPRGELHKNIDDVEAMKAVLDLCRSRIRPAATYGGWHFENGKIVPNRMPEGVPSVDELAEIGYTVLRDTYRSKGHTVFFDWSGIGDDEKESYIAQTAAIRDRVIAGMGAQAGDTVTIIRKTMTADTFGHEDGTPVPIMRAYTDADVEKLALVLCKVAHEKFGYSDWESTAYQDAYRLAARAALDWMGATVGECNECEKLKEQRKALRKIVLDGAEEVRARIDAARAALEGERCL